RGQACRHRRAVETCGRPVPVLGRPGPGAPALTDAGVGPARERERFRGCARSHDRPRVVLGRARCVWWTQTYTTRNRSSWKDCGYESRIGRTTAFKVRGRFAGGRAAVAGGGRNPT